MCSKIKLKITCSVFELLNQKSNPGQHKYYFKYQPFFLILKTQLTLTFCMVLLFHSEKHSSFVRVVLQNVTLETEVGKGMSPTWEQEFVL